MWHVCMYVCTYAYMNEQIYMNLFMNAPKYACTYIRTCYVLLRSYAAIYIYMHLLYDPNCLGDVLN